MKAAKVRLLKVSYTIEKGLDTWFVLDLFGNLLNKLERGQKRFWKIGLDTTFGKPLASMVYEINFSPIKNIPKLATSINKTSNIL